MKTVYLSLGSNLGSREKTLLYAVIVLTAPDLRLTWISSVYETEPQDVNDHP